MLDYRCYFCFCRLFEKLLSRHSFPEDVKQQLSREFISFLDKTEPRKPTPEIARDIHLWIKRVLNNPDPYKNEKKAGNLQMMKLYPQLKVLISNSPDPFNTALRLAVAGNVIDFGPAEKFNIHETIEHVLSVDFAINDSANLEKQISKARTVLYIGDNAGEIVMDKLFVETLRHKNIFFAVRSGPVINDATTEDALSVGIDKYTSVIETGYDAPSVILEKASKDFLKVFKTADVIISKGQGNLEGLIDIKDDRIFFLFMVKCDAIARKIGAAKGDFVVMKNHRNSF